MDALRIIMIIVAALTLRARAMTPETDSLETGVPEETMVPETTTPAPTTPPSTQRAPPRNCSTARALQGICTARQECDHSTGPVDHSLYAPSWYRSPCEDGEVCCPFSSLIPETPKTEDRYLDDDFDDDDF